MPDTDEADKQSDGEAHRTSRREGFSVKAVEPDEGKECEVIISHRRLHNVSKRSRGQILECAQVVTEILQFPKAIFEGLKRNEDEAGSDVSGWRCYCGVPSCAYVEDGTKVPPWERETFLVFVNVEKVAYLWYWYKSDKNNPDIPVDYVERFDERKL